MKFRTVRLAECELDVELLILTVLIATGAAGIAWLLLSMPTPHCLLLMLTGVPCPTCGGTRCVRSLLSAHYLTAFEWNPLVFLGILGAAFYGFYAAVVTAMRLPRIRIGNIVPREARLLRIAICLVVAANWIYLIFRFSRGA